MTRSYFSVVVEHPAPAVWSVVRDFNSLATWFDSAVSESHIEDGLTGTTVGAVRSFQLGADRIRERLLALSDIKREYSYEFCDPPPFPVEDYVATLRVRPVSATDQSLVEWSVSFDCSVADRAQWSAFFAAEVFEPALNNLKEYLSRRS